MVTLRCTRSLLAGMSNLKSECHSVPSTVLGDWCCGLLRTRPEKPVICMNERSLLVVVVEFKDFISVGLRFRNRVAALLSRIGIASTAVDGEVQAMLELGFGSASNRRVLGYLSEAVYQIAHKLGNPGIELQSHIEDYCARHVYSSARIRQPKEVALELFSSSRVGVGRAIGHVH